MWGGERPRNFFSRPFSLHRRETRAAFGSRRAFFMPIPPSRNRFLKKFFVLRIPGIFWRQILRNKFVPGILREGIWLTRFFASVFVKKNFSRRIPANKKILAGRRTKFLRDILGEEIWRNKFVQMEILGQKCAPNALPKFFAREFGATNSHLKVLRQRIWWARVLEKVLRG